MSDSLRLHGLYTVYGILQARILELVALPFSRGIFPTQGLNPGLPHCREILYHLSQKGSPITWIRGVISEKTTPLARRTVRWSRTAADKYHRGRMPTSPLSTSGARPETVLGAAETRRRKARWQHSFLRQLSNLRLISNLLLFTRVSRLSLSSVVFLGTTLPYFSFIYQW